MDKQRNHKKKLENISNCWKRKYNIPKLQDAANAGVRRNLFIALKGYLRESEGSQISTERTPQQSRKTRTELQPSRRKQIINILVEINQIENRKTTVCNLLRSSAGEIQN